MQPSSGGLTGLVPVERRGLEFCPPGFPVGVDTLAGTPTGFLEHRRRLRERGGLEEVAPFVDRGKIMFLASSSHGSEFASVKMLRRTARS